MQIVILHKKDLSALKKYSKNILNVKHNYSIFKKIKYSYFNLTLFFKIFLNNRSIKYTASMIAV